VFSQRGKGYERGWHGGGDVLIKIIHVPSLNLHGKDGWLLLGDESSMATLTVGGGRRLLVKIPGE
jgi:hypothetical protein